MARLEISDGLYQQIAQQADKAGLSLEDWLATTTGPELQELYTWFFGLMSHDLRAPLAAIVTSSEILKYYQSRLTEDRRLEHLDTIQEQVYSFGVLLSNVRTLERIAQGALECKVATHDLVEFAQTICREVNNMVHNSHEIVVVADDEEIVWSFDERLLRLALSNVLLNAIQFSPPTSPIQLRLAISPHQVCISVTDSGSGIPAEAQAQVFDLYYRASNTTHSMGQGLGLTVARRVVELHNGSMSLSSASGEGTTVSISLPA